MKLESSRRRDLLCLAVLYIVYLASMVVASICTSPLYPHIYGDDSALFALLGKGVLEGKILYADLFDHKGPFIFFINALGQMLGGYYGIFAVQCICGFVSMAFLYFTAKMLDTTGKPALAYLAIFAAVYVVFFRVFQQGNLTEEYSQPAISAALYMFVKYGLRVKENPDHPPLYAFFYGIFFMALAFLRLTNAATVCAGILAIFVYLICKKRFRNLLWNLLAGLGGMAVVAVPVGLYFLAYGALYDMIYATFLYNANIVGKTGVASILDNLHRYIVLYLPMAITGLLLVVHIARERKVEFLDVLLGCVLAVNFYMFYLANRYPHYFAIYVPVYLVFLARYFRLALKRAATYVILFAIFLCTFYNLQDQYYMVTSNLHYSYVSKSSQILYESIREVTDHIPEEERDSVIGYQMPVSYYMLADIVPCHKYYTWQETWAVVDPEILTEFMDWIQTENPTWILVTPQEDNETILALLDSRYEAVAGNDRLVSYRLK